MSEMIQMWIGLHFRLPLHNYLLLSLSALVYLYGGWPFLSGSIKELRDRKPGMMLLITMAISVAFLYSVATVFIIIGADFFWELATLIDIMLLGHWLEMKSVMGASNALKELAGLLPSKANKIDNGNMIEIEISELITGDIVLARPGETIPADGIIIDGQSHVNESLLTGESKPVRKSKNDKVIGGSINGEDGALTILLEKTGEKTYLSQVINLVKKAQESRSKTQDLANRAAALLFYIAMAGGVITAAVWLIIGRPDEAITRSVTVLIIACPHALGLAIPLVVSISTSLTARTGILIRDRSAFERLRIITTIVFDKTGTLTQGKFGVNELVSLKPENELLKLAASVEQNSEHILAKAIVDYAKSKHIELLPVQDFEAVTGKWVGARVEGSEVLIGGPKLLKEKGIITHNEKIEQMIRNGQTVLYCIVDNELWGAFGLSDIIRRESRQAIKRFNQMGIKVYMLTGDAKQAAKAVADELGINDYYAEVLPDEKSKKIEELKQKGEKVAMVGDGVNDAPALVAADIGIAVGAGASVAIESADIVLVNNNPEDVLKTIEFSRKTYSKMVQNLWWAAGYNVITMPLAAGVLYNYGIIVDPAIGALLMSLSTIIVALNSQTLRKNF